MSQFLKFSILAYLLALSLSTAMGKEPAAGQGEALVIMTLIKVDDGDSFAAYDQSGTRHRVRLAAIDAPERSQHHGRQAGEHLEDLLAGKAIAVYVRKKDRYKRLVARVLVNGSNVGLSQVSAGHAWHFKRFAHEQPAKERALFQSAQQRAKDAQIGLWQRAEPTPPWQWRRQKRKKR